MGDCVLTCPWAVPLLSELLLVCICVSADRLNAFPGQSQWRAAIRDSAVHGSIAVLSWAVYCEWKGNRTQDALLCVLCGALGMAVDADHFVAAKTLTLKRALSHPSRAFLHATTIVPILAILISVLSRLMSWKSGGTLSVMLTIAWLSHHIRDGVRRGLWLPPFGSTPPLSLNLYVFCTAMLPIAFKGIRWYLDSFSRFSRTETLKGENTIIVEL